LTKPTISRRNLLCSLAAMGASLSSLRGLALLPGANPQPNGSDAASPRIRLGAQTNAWPIDPNKFDTLRAALGEIRGTGYAGFETGFANLRSQSKSLPQARQQIEATGLVFIGVHIFLSEYDAITNIAPQQLYEPVAQTGAALGAKRLIFSGSPAVTEDEIKRKADALNRAGEFAGKLGLKVAYHNHWPEFKYNAKEIEALYAATDPKLVWFLLDAGHAYRTGIDLPDFVRRHSQRLTAIHFRDYRDHVQVPLGQGNLPLAEIASVLKKANWAGWAMNEEEREDGSKQGLAVIRPAFESLKGAFSV
jgi:sugar phosphate isomerase/epimerase